MYVSLSRLRVPRTLLRTDRDAAEYEAAIAGLVAPVFADPSVRTNPHMPMTAESGELLSTEATAPAALP